MFLQGLLENSRGEIRGGNLRLRSSGAPQRGSHRAPHTAFPHNATWPGTARPSAQPRLPQSWPALLPDATARSPIPPRPTPGDRARPHPSSRVSPRCVPLLRTEEPPAVRATRALRARATRIFTRARHPDARTRAPPGPVRARARATHARSRAPATRPSASAPCLLVHGGPELMMEQSCCCWPGSAGCYLLSPSHPRCGEVERAATACFWVFNAASGAREGRQF